MKKSLILSTCILTLTTTPLFASQHDDLEDASNVARQQLAMSQFEEQKRTADVAKLQRLLSTPNADLDEIASLPFDLQIEYADRRSAQGQQQAIATTSTPGQHYIGAPHASSTEREFIEKVETLLAFGEWAPLADINSLPTSYLNMYYERLRAAQEESQQVITSTPPMPSMVEPSRRPAAAQVTSPQLIPNIQSLPSSTSPIMLPTEEPIMLPTEDIQGDREEQARAHNQIIDQQAQALLTQREPNLSSVAEDVVVRYLELLTAPAIMTSPSSPVITNSPSASSSRSSGDAEIDMVQLEEQFARAALMAEQNNDFALAESVDMRTNQLRQQIAQRGVRIAQATVRLQALDQQLEPIQALVSERDTTIARIRQLTDLAQRSQAQGQAQPPINPRFQSRVDELNLQIPTNYAELKREFEALTASLETERASQAAAQEELTSLSTH